MACVAVQKEVFDVFDLVTPSTVFAYVRNGTVEFKISYFLTTQQVRRKENSFS